jgi:dUTPase
VATLHTWCRVPRDKNVRRLPYSHAALRQIITMTNASEIYIFPTHEDAPKPNPEPACNGLAFRAPTDISLKKNETTRVNLQYRIALSGGLTGQISGLSSALFAVNFQTLGDMHSADEISVVITNPSDDDLKIPVGTPLAVLTVNNKDTTKRKVKKIGSEKALLGAIKKASRKPRMRRDPLAPKGPLSSYMFFLQDVRAARKADDEASLKKAQEDWVALGHDLADFKAEKKGGVGATSKIEGEQWKKMTVEEKKVYEDKAAAAKEEYKIAMAAYTASKADVPPPPPAE